ncbi:uncharacterized protein [Leptinotarsa decemlineata]|uniref:uncharacterized protein n=1 Tax=Leptinotarsa decemlineata TaxID=7539 RepID=UPI003D308147
MEKFVCRTCLYVNHQMTSFKIVEKVKEILESFVPEIKPSISADSIVCTQCYYFLKNIENFKHKCIENQKKLTNLNVYAHSSSQEFQLNSQTYITIIPRGESSLTCGEKQKSDIINEPKLTSVVESPKDAEQEQRSNIKSKSKNSSFSKPSSSNLRDFIEISDSDVELNDKTKFGYSESSCDEDDVFEEKPAITIVKNEPEMEINPSFFNRKSDEGYYHCRLCTKKYKHSEGLYNHTRAEHKELKFYHCNSCNFFTLWKSALGRHESLFHLEEESTGSSKIEDLYLFCYHCPFKTKSKAELENHIQVHFNYRVTTYTCSKCKKNFAKKSLYDFHMNSHKRGEITICVYCLKSYTKKYLKKHLTDIHGVYETHHFCGN